MEWTYREVGTNFQPLHVDFGQPGGELFRPPGNGAIDFNTGNSVDALADLTAETITKGHAVAEARNLLDSLYQNSPSLRDVPISVDAELLPAESFDDFIQNQGLKSARPIDERPPDLSDVQSGRPSTNNAANRGSLVDDAIDVGSRPVTQSLDDVGRLGNILPRTARLIGNPATQGLIDVGVGLVQGDSLPRAGTGAIGSTGGGFAGAYIGGAIGAGIGSIIPVVGTGAGAAIGGFVGGWIGGQIGGDAFRGAFDALFPGATDEQRQAMQPSPSASPFQGGQSVGVSYWVDVYREQHNADGSLRSGYPDVYTVRATGPIQGLRVRDASGVYVLELLHNGPAVYLGNTSTPGQYWANHRITRTRREDGQPDTGGSLPTNPTTPIAPGSRLLSNPNNDRFNNYHPTGEPQPTRRGDNSLFPTAGRLAPGSTAPIEAGPNLVSQPPTTPKTPATPQLPSEPSNPPSRTGTLPDPDYGWGRTLVPDLTPGAHPYGRPPELPGLTASSGNSTPTGIREGNNTPRPPGTGLDTAIPVTENDSKKDSECDPCTLLNQIKEALLEEVTMQIAYNACNSEQPDVYSVTAPRIKAIGQILEFKDIYDDMRGHHACDLSPAIPESWAWKVGGIPQLVIQFAEDVTPGKSARWSVSIPHYRFPSSYQPIIPSYVRGNCMGTLILNDNSQLIINCKDETEWNKFLIKIVPLINPDLMLDSVSKTTKRRGKTIEQKKVKPVYAKFFSTGQKNLVPDWIISF